MSKLIVGTFPSTITSISAETLSANGNAGFHITCMGVPRRMWVSKAEQEGGTIDYGEGPVAVVAKNYKANDVVTINRREDGSYSFSSRDFSKEQEALAFQAKASLALDFGYQQQLAKNKGLAAAAVAANPAFSLSGQGAPTIVE